MPTPTLGSRRLGTRRSWWAALFGGRGDVPEGGGSAVGSVRVLADDPTLPQRYTGTMLGRAPLRELGATDTTTVRELRGTRRVDEIRFGIGVARSNRRADVLQATLDAARAGQRARVPSASTAADAAAFAGSFHWSLSIPGTHYSGLTNDALMEIMEANGRPFLSDTPQLRQHVRERLVAAFAGAPWDRSRATTVAARAVREWVVMRIEQQGVDIELDELDPDYRAEKIAAGFDRRIGVKTKAWLGSVKSAVVEVAA